MCDLFFLFIDLSAFGHHARMLSGVVVKRVASGLLDCNAKDSVTSINLHEYRDKQVLLKR